MLTTKKRVGDRAFPFSGPSQADRAPGVRRGLSAAGARPFLALVAVAGLLTACAPSGPKALLRGEQLIREGRPLEAIPKLETAVQLLPDSAPAWNFLGLANHHARRVEQAIAAYQKAIARDRNYFVTYYNLGSLYYEQGNWAGAADALTTYTLIRPQPVEGWLKLGLAQFRARQFDLADRSLREAVNRNRKLPEALNALGVIEIQRRRPREAYNYFNAAVNAERNYPPALLNAAITAHQHLNQKPFALQVYRAYLALQPRPANAAAVQVVAQQLEWELNPQLRTVPANTNVARVPVVTNLPPPVVTSAPPARVVAQTPPLAPTNPAPVVSASVATPTNKPPSVAKVVTNPPPTRTVVAETPRPPATVVEKKEPSKELPKEQPKVTPPPEPEPVRKVVVKPEITPPVAAPVQPAASTPAPKASEPVVVKNEPPTPAATAPDAASAKPDGKEKSGLISRLNPKTWFAGREKPTTPLPDKNAPATKPAPPGRTVTTLPSNSPEPAPPGPAPVVSIPETPRYKYRAPGRPVPGDNARAAKLFAEGYAFHQSGRLAAAMDSYRAATEADPAYFDAHHNLGLAALQAGDLSRALASGELALSLDPASPGARYNFALALQRAGYLRDAANELEEVAQRKPGDTNAHLTLANLYAQQLARNDDARRHYFKVLELDPRHPQAAAIRNWIDQHP